MGFKTMQKTATNNRVTRLRGLCVSVVIDYMNTASA